MVNFDQNRLADLCQRHGVSRLRLFGSAARGEERPDSDIDILVDFDRPVGYLELIRFENALSDFFGRAVDLVTEPGLSPFNRDAVLASASVIFDARLAERLIASLDEDAEVEVEWQTEAERRDDEFTSGEAAGVSLDSALDSARARLR